MKAKNVRDVKKFTDIPNVGSAMERDFNLLGIKNPQDLKKKDAFTLYKRICKISGSRQDPCVLDTYLAVIAFVNGGEARPWWEYTEGRKKEYGEI